MFRFRKIAYLDNNATTRPTPNVISQITKTLRKCYTNPSSNYLDARDASLLLEDSRQAVAESIGAYPEEIIFTSCASESNNQLLFSALQNASNGRNVIISSHIEHPSVINTLDFLQKNGNTVKYCPIDHQGRIIFNELESMVDDKTLLVCCMYANNEIGVLQDIGRIAALAHQKGAWIMSDCVQAFGKVPINVKALGVDFASFSAHKIHGPKGAGATFIRSGLPISPFIHGGHQENGLRAGTESVHNIAGFAEACRNIRQSLQAVPRITELRDRLASGIQQILPVARINSPHGKHRQRALCNTLNITLPGFDAAEAIAFLDYNGISVSAGSACNTQANEPSHVLKAIGLSDEESRQTLRFSLSKETTNQEISYSLEVLRDFLERRKLPVSMVRPDQLDENLLFNEQTFIVDIRYGYDRKILKGLPNSHETSFSELRANLNRLPRDKNILIICQGGTDGPVVAYHLRSKGFTNVSFVMGGMIGWKIFNASLYEKYAGMNKTSLIDKHKTEVS